MRSQNDKATWSILRFDHRTFTAQLARMQKVKPVTEIPDKYIYIDDYCFKGDGKIKEVILPSSCRIIGREAFASCQFRKPGDISANFSGDQRRGLLLRITL